MIRASGSVHESASRALLPIAFACVAVAGCGEASPAPEGAPAPAHATVRGHDVEPSGPPFDIQLDAAPAYAIGETATFGVSVRPRGAFHVETRYPWQVSLHECDGVALARTELGGRDATRLDVSEARFDVAFVAERTGSHRCVLDVDFAVCGEGACLPAQRRVAVDLHAS